ncbi:PPOX class F420-dependent oxidoreductase [Nonomuraea sp. NPDC050310]|uniref:PPOX class F420-dependent oxidoreductase n=1 Tax=unclassified Nonomuraea TaxID=2593643 RepID=UPI0033FBA8CC
MNLGTEQYVSVTTFRKDGTPMATPVWVVPYGEGALAFWTVTASGKIKRIRRDPNVTVAPCDVRGNLRGEPVPGKAELLDPAETARVRTLLGRKYGVLGRLIVWSSRIRRGAAGTVGVKITGL